MVANIHRQGSHAGFTLIELIVVIAIISILMAMLMPIYGVVQQSNMRSKTQFIERKVDACLRMFKSDYGVYPYQRQYPDLASGEAANNNLYYRLGTNLDTSAGGARDHVLADASAAATKYNYMQAGITGGTDTLVATPGLTYASTMSPVGNGCTVTLLNRMARVQMRMAVLSGNIDMRGPVVCKNDLTLFSDRTNITVLSSPAQSGTRLGLASDYFNGEIEQRFITNDTILDSWGTPLVYICQIVPGIRCSGDVGYQTCQDIISPQYGLGSLGFDPRTGPGPNIINGPRPTLLQFGRIRLSLSTSGDNLPTPQDTSTPSSFPDATNLLHSDVRYYAMPGYELEFELWSSGRDKKFSYMRDDPQNKDNLSVVLYNRGSRND